MCPMNVKLIIPEWCDASLTRRPELLRALGSSCLPGRPARGQSAGSRAWPGPGPLRRERPAGSLDGTIKSAAAWNQETSRLLYLEVQETF
ncbi:unnamed protein product [Caretta caretta]